MKFYPQNFCAYSINTVQKLELHNTRCKMLYHVSFVQQHSANIVMVYSSISMPLPLKECGVATTEPHPLVACDVTTADLLLWHRRDHNLQRNDNTIMQ